GSGIDVDGKNARALALQVEGEVPPAALQQLVGEPVGDERVEAFEVEQRLDIAAAGGIAIEHGGQVSAKGAPQLGLFAQHLRKGLADQAGIDIGMIEPLRQTMANRL